jgi:hypothetical protein
MRKKGHKDRGRKPSEPLASQAGVAAMRPLLPLVVMAGLIAGAVWGLERVKALVYASPAYRPAAVKVVLADPPDWVVREKWADRILSAVALPRPEAWMDEQLTRRVADQIVASGWVKSVSRVAKRMDGTIEIAADYRRPIAMLMTDQGYVPVDRDGYRLPEVYDHVDANSGWIRIRGVTAPLPKVSAAYEPKTAPDAVAAVRLATLIFDQGWEVSSRISAIDVTNFRGRADNRDCHIKLWMPDGTLIKWGSAIGEEIEENTLAEKLAQIAVMLKRGGPQAQVDVSTLPNRSIVTMPPAIETADISNRRAR